MNCPHCGAEFVEGGKYCAFCGATAPGEAGASRPSSSPPPAPPPAAPPVPLPSATGQIAFSIVNILCLSGSIFGIVGLVFSLLAAGARSVAEALQYLRVARVVNLVGISIAALLLLAWLAMLVLSFVLPLFLLIPFAFLFPSPGPTY